MQALLKESYWLLMQKQSTADPISIFPAPSLSSQALALFVVLLLVMSQRTKNMLEAGGAVAAERHVKVMEEPPRDSPVCGGK